MAFCFFYSFSCSANSDQSHGFFISSMLTHYQVGNDRKFSSDYGSTIGVGYQFENEWAMEISHIRASVFDKTNQSGLDINHIKLDALYVIHEDRWSPYAAFGISQGKYDFINQLDIKETYFNFGGGFTYKIFEQLSLRSDLRFLRRKNNGDLDVNASIGLFVDFGHQKPNVSAHNSLRRTDLDTDQDGVLDQHDLCPNSKIGWSVNEQGCQIRTEELVSPSNIRFLINFPNDSSDIEDKYSEVMSNVSEFMHTNSSLSVIFIGHTDDKGTRKYNQSLSERRANSVARELIYRYNVDASRIGVKGYGETRPIVENIDELNRAKNRRVEAIFE